MPDFDAMLFLLLKRFLILFFCISIRIIFTYKLFGLKVNSEFLAYASLVTL